MKKILIIIGAIALVGIITAVAIVTIISISSKKMKCESSKGNITIAYNDDEVVGYAANGFNFDLDSQKSYSKLIGIEAYLDEFESWFEDNTGGVCER